MCINKEIAFKCGIMLASKQVFAGDYPIKSGGLIREVCPFMYNVLLCLVTSFHSSGLEP